jgi:hypothetical protein
VPLLALHWACGGRLLKEQRRAFDDELAELRGHREGAAAARREVDMEMATERQATADAQLKCREAERAAQKARDEAAAKEALAEQRASALDLAQEEMRKLLVDLREARAALAASQLETAAVAARALEATNAAESARAAAQAAQAAEAAAQADAAVARAAAQAAEAATVAAAYADTDDQASPGQQAADNEPHDEAGGGEGRKGVLHNQTSILGKDFDLDESPGAPSFTEQLASALRSRAARVLDLFREMDENEDGTAGRAGMEPGLYRVLCSEPRERFAGRHPHAHMTTRGRCVCAPCRAQARCLALSSVARCPSWASTCR